MQYKQALSLSPSSPLFNADQYMEFLWRLRHWFVWCVIMCVFVVVGSSGMVYAVILSYFAMKHSYHLDAWNKDARSQTSFFKCLISSSSVTGCSLENLCMLDCTMYCLVWGEEWFGAENPFPSQKNAVLLFLPHTYTLSLCFSLHEWGLYWRHQLILLECWRNVKDESGIEREREIEKEGLCG